MKLFTKAIEAKLQKQYKKVEETKNNSLESQDAVCKIFNPYGAGYWFILNQDPNDPDYLWCIAKITDVEVGSVAKSDLVNMKFGGYNLPLERDLNWGPMNAKEVYDKLLKGEHV
jgi:hypothetical protein